MDEGAGLRHAAWAADCGTIEARQAKSGALQGPTQLLVLGYVKRKEIPRESGGRTEKAENLCLSPCDIGGGAVRFGPAA